MRLRIKDIRKIPGRIWTSVKYYFGGLYNRLGEHHVFMLAGGMAFAMIICFMPLILILFSVLGIVLDRPAIESEIDELINRVVPYSDAADWIRGFIATRVKEFTAYKNLAGIIGSIGLIFAATGLFSAMRTILNTVYQTEQEESILYGKVRDLGFVGLVLLYFLLIALVGPGTDFLAWVGSKTNWLQDFYLGPVQILLIQVVSFALIFLGFFAIYFAVPVERPPRKAILWSAFWAALLWHIVAEGFAFYVSNFYAYERIYGTYGLLIGIAFWIYYTSIVFVTGAEIGQLYRELHRPRAPFEPSDDSPSQFFPE